MHLCLPWVPPPAAAAVCHRAKLAAQSLGAWRGVSVWCSEWVSEHCLWLLCWLSQVFSLSRSLSGAITMCWGKSLPQTIHCPHAWMNLVTNKHTHTEIRKDGRWFEHTQRSTHKEGEVCYAWVLWVFSASCKDYYWLQLPPVGGCWAGRVSSGGHLLCFNSTVGKSVHQASSLCRLCLFTGETFLRKGAIGPAERNISTTKKDNRTRHRQLSHWLFNGSEFVTP